MKSKSGFHSGAINVMEGIGAYWRKLDNAGIPIFHKATDGFGPLYEIAHLPNPHGVEHHLVFRLSTEGQGDGKQYDVPPYHKSPEQAALEHWQTTRNKMPQEMWDIRHKVWWEVANELDKDRADWIGRWGVHMAQLANADGFKILIPGWSSGEPEVVSRNDWDTEGMLMYLAQCHPQKSGVSGHEYDFNLLGYDAVYPYHIGRFQWIFDACDRHGIARPSVYITEWGWARDFTPEWDEAKKNIEKADELYCLYPQVKGFATWHLGTGFGDNVARQTQRLIVPLGEYALNNNFIEGTVDQPLDPDFFEDNTGGNPAPVRIIESFEGGWTDISGRIQQPNGFQIKVIEPGEPLWYTGRYASGTVEAKHLICREQLPATQCADGPDPLILDYKTTYKIQAVNMMSGTSLSKVFPGNGRMRITVPVNVHWQGDHPREEDDVYVALVLNGKEVDILHHPILKDRVWVALTGEAEAPVTAELRFQTSYKNSRDCFTDRWVAEEIETEMEQCFPPQKEIVMVVPSELSPDELSTLTAWAYNGIPGHTQGKSARHGFWFSPQTAVNTVMAGLPTSELYIVDGGRIGTGDGVTKAWLEENCPRVLTERTVKWISLSQPPGDYLPVQPLNQRDPRWALKKIGVGSHAKTIGNWGCLLVAYNMMARFWELTSRLPDAENDHYVAMGCFDNQYVKPAALRTAYPAKVDYDGYLKRDNPTMRPKIREWLDAGRPVPAQVDFNPATGQWEQHWVLLIGWYDEEFYMADPWHGDITTVNSRYPIPGSDVLQAIFYHEKEPSGVYTGPEVTYTPVIHGPGSDWMWNTSEVTNLMNQLKMPVKFMTNGTNREKFPVYNKPPYHLVRVFWQPNQPRTPEQVWGELSPDIIDIFSKGARNFELFNEPNLPSEGLGIVWADGTSFGAWLRKFAQLFKQALPTARLWYPGLSPGVPWTNQFAFTDAAWPHVKDLCYGMCVHAYTGNTSNVQVATAEIVDQVRGFQIRYTLDRPLVVSECSVNRGFDIGHTPTAAELHNLYVHKASVYRAVDQALKSTRGIQATCYYISKWDAPPSQAHHRENWAGTELPSLYLG